MFGRTKEPKGTEDEIYNEEEIPPDVSEEPPVVRQERGRSETTPKIPTVSKIDWRKVTPGINLKMVLYLLIGLAVIWFVFLQGGSGLIPVQAGETKIPSVQIPEWTVWVALIGGFGYFLKISVVFIKEGTAGIVFTNFGTSFARILQSGYHIIIPVLNKVEIKDVRDFNLDPEIFDAPTSENIKLKIDIYVIMRIVDVFEMEYRVKGAVRIMENVVVGAVREVIAGLTIENYRGAYEEIDRVIRARLTPYEEKYGVYVGEVNIREILPPDVVLEAAAKRKAAMDEGEAIRIRAQAEADALKTIQDAVGPEGWRLIRQMDALEKAAESGDLIIWGPGGGGGSLVDTFAAKELRDRRKKRE